MCTVQVQSWLDRKFNSSFHVMSPSCSTYDFSIRVDLLWAISYLASFQTLLNLLYDNTDIVQCRMDINCGGMTTQMTVRECCLQGTGLAFNHPEGEECYVCQGKNHTYAMYSGDGSRVVPAWVMENYTDQHNTMEWHLLKVLQARCSVMCHDCHMSLIRT